MKILHVEDESDIRDLARLLVSMEPDFEYSEAQDGRAALDFTDADLPDVVLLDYMMPRLNGLEVLEAWRSSERTKDILVIVVSAVPPAKLEPVKALGVFDIVPKPFDITGLMDTIRAAAGNAAAA